MFNWIRSFFNTPLNTIVKQTGLIVVPPSEKDWNKNESGIVGVVRMPNGDWTQYLPVGEKQYKMLSFDSMSCATFSALNVIETFIKYLKPNLSVDHLNYFKLFNFIDDNGEFNASDNFTSIMSGTTEIGNSFPAVWNSIRNDGLVSEKDFPFGGDTINQFLDRNRISAYMKQRAKIFTKFFTVQYAWIHYAQKTTNTPAEIQAMQNALMESPLQIGVVIPASHAEELVQYGGGYKTFFNSYEPYLSKFEDVFNPIHFSMKAVIIPNINVPKFPVPTVNFTSTLEMGVNGAEVLALQNILCYFGFMNIATGYFGILTQSAVKDFQIFYGLPSVGVVGPRTREILNNFLK